ncbi:MAG: archaeal proteasome endopeptidase complex subunit beta [Euryarchaeota archaeon]|nr:archaeal proteasome endopeptidase complex subunit beta [Euryarchaeota archaeon]
MTIKRTEGTTTVGLVCKDGVVLATEKRALAGYLIASKRAKKIYEVDLHLGATIAGGVGDSQALVRIIQANAKLYKYEHGLPISVEAVANLASNVLFNQRWFPFITELIVGGVDRTGYRLFFLDPVGGLLEDKMISTGSGSPLAYGVLEDQFQEDLPVDTGVNLAIRALRVAMERDAASGNGIEVVTITKEAGFKTLPQKDVEDRLKKIKG